MTPSLNLTRPNLFGSSLQCNQAEIKEPYLAPRYYEGKENQHDVVGQRVIVPRIFKYFSYEEGHSESGSESDRPPVGEIKEGVKDNANKEPGGGHHHAVEHAGTNGVLQHLLVQLPC